MNNNPSDDLDSLIENVKNICKKKANERTQSELIKLMEITKNAKVFKQLVESKGDIAHNTCCRFLLYECCEANDYLFRFGDKGTKFYIIIKGKIGIEIPIKNEETGETNFVEVVQLGNGAAFGELALESSKPRAASIKCKVQTHFMVLEKHDYDHMIAKVVRDKRNQLVNFLQSLPIFSKSTKGTLTKLTYNFKEKNYMKNQVVYREGESSNTVYLVRSGEFAFYKKIRVEKGITRYPKDIKGLNKDHTHQSQVAILGVGELFGEEGVMEEAPRRSSCICLSSNALVLTLGKNDFLRRIRGEDSWNAIKSRTEDKVKSIDERVTILTRIEEEKIGSLTPRKRRKREKELEKLLKAAESQQKSPLRKSETNNATIWGNSAFSKRQEPNSRSLLYKMVELELGQKILSKTSLVGKLQDKSAPRLTRVPESEKYIQKSKSILLQNIMQTKTDPDNSPEKLPFYEHKRSISALRMPPSERSLLKSSLRHISPMGARNISPLSSRRHKSPNHSPSTMEKIQDNLTVCKGVAFYSMNAFPIYQGLWNATGKPKRSMSNGRPSAKTDRSYANF